MIEFSARQIADFLSGTISGDPETKVGRIAKIEEADPGSLSFLANPAYTNYLYTTRASIVLVRTGFMPERPVSCTLIRVEDPYSALARLLEMYQASLPQKSGISDLACISDTAVTHESNYVGPFAYIGAHTKLGEHVKIYPHVYLGDHVEIGDHTILYSGVRIYDRCVIGRSCTVHANAVIGADGFGFAPQGGENGFMKVQQIGNVIIEDHVEIGAGTAIDRATIGSTIIKKGVKLDNLIQIGHNVVVGENTVMAGQSGVAGSTKIGKNCMIGGQVGFAGHLTIGDDVKIGAQSGITNDIKSGEIRLGSPAIDAAKYRKSFIHFRNFEKIVARIDELEKLLKKK